MRGHGVGQAPVVGARSHHTCRTDPGTIPVHGSGHTLPVLTAIRRPVIRGHTTDPFKLSRVAEARRWQARSVENHRSRRTRPRRRHRRYRQQTVTDAHSKSRRRGHEQSATAPPTFLHDIISAGGGGGVAGSWHRSEGSGWHRSGK